MVAKRNLDSSNREKTKPGGGPRTTAGKRRSRMNARKHGLSTPLAVNRHINKSVLDLAHFIAGEGANDAIFCQALIVAECELMLQHIHQARVTAIDSPMARQGQDKREMARDSAKAFAKALPTLCCIERYERRTHSRRQKALQNLKGLQVIARLND